MFASLHPTVNSGITRKLLPAAPNQNQAESNATTPPEEGQITEIPASALGSPSLQ
jgi:hypothetical protein